MIVMKSPRLSVTVYEVFFGGEGIETHRASCVELLGRDADLGAKAELSAVGKAC